MFRDQLAAVGEKIEDAELVNIALNGFPASWESFVKGICVRRTFLTLRGFGMIVSRRRLGWSQRPTIRVVVRT